MGIYIKSTGEQLSTEEMNDVYIQRALLRARREGNQENIKALEEELVIRSGE